MSSSYKLDCSGLVCPMPVAKTKRQLLEMNSGDILEVTGDLAEAGENIKRYLDKKKQDIILEYRTEGEKFYFKIEKA
jgi:TusA-related sulfurtransferase